MQLKPFLLDKWLDNYEHDIEFDLAASTGPRWTVNEILNLAGEEERQRFLNHELVYSRPAGADGLREAIAEMHDVSAECVLVMTGASEALVVLMWMAAEPGANVILPRPGFTTFSALPESLGLETRFYGLRKENNFTIDVEEIMQLADGKTNLILVNSPHNPTGAAISDAEMERLHEFTSTRGIQLVSDEVYHPIYHGRETKSASRLPQATVIHDFSKAFSVPGVRTGWMIEHDRKRRERYWNARAYFSISNNSAGEMLAEIAMRSRDAVLWKTQETAARNLEHLDRFMAGHQETLAWIRPQGGMTAFPWLVSGENARPFCQAAAEQGILLAPGDCFDCPSHFRLGFAATGREFPRALDRLGKFVDSWGGEVASAFRKSRTRSA
ncbi:MAG: aminotransferase class I/II-fold pyridoxal phosphate-dependent enzyme [Candidatus Sulfotelmatobacter sp.]